MEHNSQRFYECQECRLKYRDKGWAEKCEAWCKEHHSCNLEIIENAENLETDGIEQSKEQGETRVEAKSSPAHQK